MAVCISALLTSSLIAKGNPLKRITGGATHIVGKVAEVISLDDPLPDLKESIRDAVTNRIIREISSRVWAGACRVIKNKELCDRCERFKNGHIGGYQLNVIAAREGKRTGKIKSLSQCLKYERNIGMLANLVRDKYTAASQAVMDWDFTDFDCACYEVNWDDDAVAFPKSKEMPVVVEWDCNKKAGGVHFEMRDDELIRSNHYGWCIDLASHSETEGIYAVLQPCDHHSRWQSWIVEPNGDSFALRNRATGMCLAPENPKREKRGNWLIQKECGNGRGNEFQYVVKGKSMIRNQETGFCLDYEAE